MNISDNKKINDFLTDLENVSVEKLKIVIALRDLFLKESSNLVEDIKYGGVVFSLSKGLIGGIYIYKEHISIEFSNGADFTDIDVVLGGKGKKRRHLKIYSQDDISDKTSEYFIKQAVLN
jgi:hypothetical protein